MLSLKYLKESHPDFRNFVKTSPRGSVSQSVYWGQLQEKVPSRGKFWAFAVSDENNKIVGTCTLVLHKLGRRNCYLYAHRGPVCDPQRIDVWERILHECDRIAAEENAMFLRLDPAWFFTDFHESDPARALVKFRSFFAKYGFQPAHAQYQPLSTLQLDLTKNLDELKSEMKSMGKRNLKKALAADLELGFVTSSQAPELEEFDRLNRITTERDGFFAHELDYYKRIMRELGKEDIARLYFAKQDGEPLAMALATFFGDEAVYYYGSSSNSKRELMAPWALQWRMICDARERGCTRYDFLGIAPQPFPLSHHKYGVWLGTHLQKFSSEAAAQKFCDRRHSFASITFFKTRWGGERRDYVGAWEKIYRPNDFRLLLFLKKARKMVRKMGLKI